MKTWAKQGEWRQPRATRLNFPRAPNALDLSARPLGRRSVTNTTAVPAEGAAGIELFGATEQVATAKAEALEPQAENEAGRGLRMAPREGEIERKRARLADAKGRATEGASQPDWLSRVGPNERERERTLSPREDLTAHGPDMP